MAEYKIMPVHNIFMNSLDYLLKNLRISSLFFAVHLVLAFLGLEFVKDLSDVLFFPWLIVYYLYWYVFFRVYFERKPYLLSGKICYTLIPSTKLFVLMLVVLTALIILPFIPPFFDAGAQWANRYMYYLQKYTEDKQALNFLTMIIFTLAFPVIVFRPMMAWIASVIGRSSLMRTAFLRTRGNYWPMFVLGAFFSFFLFILEFLGGLLGNQFLAITLGSALMLFLNVIFAKSYEHFFLEIEQ